MCVLSLLEYTRPFGARVICDRPLGVTLYLSLEHLLPEFTVIGGDSRATVHTRACFGLGPSCHIRELPGFVLTALLEL